MKRQRGFGAVMAIIVLVILAALSSAMLKLHYSQQLSSAQDVLTAKALAAARSGNDWGLYQALRAGGIWSACSNATQILDLSADSGFLVKVSCDSKTYNEGESVPGTPQVLRVYLIEATACNSATTCPDPSMATSPGYVERKRQVTATN